MLRFARIVTAVCWLTPLALQAQAGDSEAGEVAALGGLSAGGGLHPVVSASTGLAFSRHGMGLISVSFIPLGNSTIQDWPARSSIQRSYLYDFGADFHVRIPIGERLSPYAIAGAGVLWNTVRANTFNALGIPIVRGYDQINGGLHTGGGVRYYINKDWGIRPEVKVIVSKHTYVQLMFGFFYVTPPELP